MYYNNGWSRKNYIIVRHYMAAKIKQRVIRRDLTENEARLHVLHNDASSMTCTSKVGKRRTKHLGHWWDTFEELDAF
jgi:hypothetical protein